MTKIIITGAKGRMGQALLRLAEKMPTLSIVGRVERGHKLADCIAQTDVVIDFTNPESIVSFAEVCAPHNKAIVIGTSGYSDADLKELQKLAAKIPIVLSANFSTGVNALFWLTDRAAKILGPDYDLEVVEMHHRHKKDSPSGTAKTLAQTLARSRQLALTDIHVHSLRGGDVVGDHTVTFATTGERLELTHKASSRDTFAGGALRAAQWIVGKPPGLYTMQDVLGLK